MSRYHIQARGPASAELLIYGDIGADPFAEASNDAKSVAAKLADTQAARLTVRINSIGGSVNDALAIFNAIRSYPGETVAVVDGVAFSAGSFIAMAAQRVEMAENALLMIHAPWMVGSGNAAKLRRAAEMLDKYAEAMAGGYTRGGRVPRERVERWLSDGADHFFTAEEAQAEGLADAVTAAIDMAAALRFTTPAATAAQQPEAIVMADHDTPAAPVSPAVDPKETVRAYDAAAKAGQEAGARAEAKRQAEIRTLFDMRAFQAPQVRAVLEQCLGDIRCDKGTAMDRALAAVEALPESSPIATAAAPAYDGGHYAPGPHLSDAPFGGFRQGAIQGGQPRSAEGIRAALEIRSGLVKDRAVIDQERSSEFLSMSLTDLMAREMRARGWRVGGTREDIARAYIQSLPVLAASGGPSHGTDHLTNILADVANKSSLMGWEAADETWNQWTIPGTLNDYREAQRANLALLDTLDKMLEHQPWNYGDLADIKQGIQGYFYGKRYGLSIQAIVNDDLGELTRAFQAWGEAASATVGAAVFTVLTAAGTNGYGQVMDEDSDPLFHADHSNYVANGSGAAPSETTLNAAYVAMATQTDQNGRTLGIRPRFIIHGATLASTVYRQLNAELLITGADATVPNSNWVRSLGLTPIQEHRMDGVFSGVAWILAAARRTVEVAGVGGPLVPRVERTMISETPGIGYEMSMPFGCAALDHRSMYFNDGN